MPDGAGGEVSNIYLSIALLAIAVILGAIARFLLQLQVRELRKRLDRHLEEK